MVDNETCVAFEFCVVETGEFVETGGVVEDAEEEVLGNVDELVVVFDVEESGVCNKLKFFVLLLSNSTWFTLPVYT